jgi:hypothetical protein
MIIVNLFYYKMNYNFVFANGIKKTTRKINNFSLRTHRPINMFRSIIPIKFTPMPSPFSDE